MRGVLAGTLLAIAAVSSDPVHFRYERAVTAAAVGQTCVTLPVDVFAHSAAGLADVRLFRDGTEVPYALQRAASPVSDTHVLTLLNLGERDGATVFDAAMPGGNYSDVVLDVARKDYIATVDVSGSQSEGEKDATRIGSYTIFDFSSQKSGSSSVLHLPASDFRYLHFHVRGPVRPDDFKGLSAGQQAAREMPYTTVAETSAMHAETHQSVTEFAVPAHVPVDRVIFVPGAEPAEFSRAVHVTVAQDRPARQEDDTAAMMPDEFSGTLLRLHRTVNGQRIDDEQLSVDIPVEEHVTPTHWTVAVENGDDAPLALEAVRLQMRSEDLCFQALPGAYWLLYGDPALSSPRYDYATLFTQQNVTSVAALGAERKNPRFTLRADERPFTERHPALLWGALVLAVMLLGGIAVRSSNRPAT